MAKNKTLKVGIIILLLTIIGKLFSFIREIVFSSIFGTSLLTDAYFSANIIPSLLNIPITISSLMFFIPIYNEIRTQKGMESANYFSSNILNIYAAITSILTLIVLLSADTLARLVAPGFGEEGLRYTVQLMRLTSLIFPITLIVSIWVNISNANQKHFAPQLLIILNNAITILAILFLSPRFGIFIVPLAGIAAWILQMFVQKKCLGSLYQYQFVFNLKDPYFKRLLWLSIPVIIASFGEQFNFFVINVLCSKLGNNSISVVNYALRIQNLINGTITVAIITIMYPVFSLLIANKDHDKFVSSLSNTIRVCLLVLVPVSLICVIGGHEIIKTIYFRGSMDFESITNISNVFMCFSIGIVFIALREIYIRIFYTLNDSKTPTIISLICMLINIGLNLVLSKYMGVVGLAIASSAVNILSFILIRKYLAKKNDFLKGMSIDPRFLMQIALASIALVGIWYLFINIFNINNLFCFLLTIFACIGCYSFVLYIMKNEDMLVLISGMKSYIGKLKSKI